MLPRFAALLQRFAPWVGAGAAAVLFAGLTSVALRWTGGGDRERSPALARPAPTATVELRAHRVTVFKAGEVVMQEPVGVGTSNTPTPGGLYYLKELLEPPDPNTVYGPYAYGLSGFSNVLTSFQGGEGVIGLHGTNDPSGLSKDVSAGCIRMSNQAITRLAGMLPLGTPVEIRR